MAYDPNEYEQVPAEDLPTNFSSSEYESVPENELPDAMRPKAKPMSALEKTVEFLHNTGTLMANTGRDVISGLKTTPGIIAGELDSEAIAAGIQRSQEPVPAELTAAQAKIAEGAKDFEKRQAETTTINPATPPMGMANPVALAAPALATIGNWLASYLPKFGGQVIDNPKGLAYLSAQQAPNMVAPLAAGYPAAAAGTAVGGPAVGAAAGVLASFSAQSPTEISSELNSLFSQELSRRGLAPTKENVDLLIADSAFSEKARHDAIVKGTVTAAVDSLGNVAAGRLTGATRRAVAESAAKDAVAAGGDFNANFKSIFEQKLKELPLSTRAADVAKGTLAEATFGGLSDAAGQGAAYDKVDPTEVALEAFMEVPGGAIEAGAMARALRTDKKALAAQKLTEATNVDEAIAAVNDMVGSVNDDIPTVTDVVSPQDVEAYQDGKLVPYTTPLETATTSRLNLQPSAVPGESIPPAGDLSGLETATSPLNSDELKQPGAGIPAAEIPPALGGSLDSATTSPLDMPTSKIPGEEIPSAGSPADSIGLVPTFKQPPLQAAVAEGLRAPRPTNIAGSPAASYSDEQLQALSSDQTVSPISRRGAEIELAHRRQETTNATNTSSTAGITTPQSTGGTGAATTGSNGVGTTREGQVPVPVDSTLDARNKSAALRKVGQDKISAWLAKENKDRQKQGLAPVASFTLAAPSPEVENAFNDVAAAFGLLTKDSKTDIVPFHDSSDSAPNGFAIGGVSYVNVAGVEIHTGHIALHEFRHVVEQIAQAEERAGKKGTAAQKAHAKFNEVFDLVSPEGRRAYIENFLYKEDLAGLDPDAREARIVELMDSEDLKQEMTADFLGSRYNDKAFWRDLAKADPKGFRGFVDRWLQVIDDLISMLRGAATQNRLESTKVDSYIKDLNKAKMLAKEALLAFRNSSQNEAAEKPRAAKKQGISVEGVHYSGAPRNVLLSSKYGTGIKGAEAERVKASRDKRLRQRIHFYVDTGKGVRPEKGVGAIAHKAKLDNIYDPDTKLIPPQKSTNAFESAVLDAGYDGYINREFGAVVMLGAREIHVSPQFAKKQTRASTEILADPKAFKEEYGLKEKRNKVREIGEALNKHTLDTQGQIPDTDTSKEARDEIARAMAEEIKVQLGKIRSSGAGWYSKNYPKALRDLGKIYPELQNSKGARSTFTALLAITSNGEKVSRNLAMARQLYETYRVGGDLMTAIPGTKRQTALDANIAVVSELLNRYGPNGAAKILLEELTVSDINKQLRAAGEKTQSAYPAKMTLPRAALYFGPKLGAFYANLMGSHGYLTMDLWWSRMFNRLRGTLVPSPTDGAIEYLQNAFGEPDADIDRLVELAEPYQEAYAAKGYKNGTELEKRANTFMKSATQELEEAPARATDRKFMLDTAEKTQQLLSKDGVDLTIADIQAALWYYEKRLYGALGSRIVGDIGYLEAIKNASESDRSERPSARSSGESSVRPELGGKSEKAAGDVPAFNKRQNIGTGREFTGFFSNITAGLTGTPSGVEYKPVLKIPASAESFAEEYSKHRGNFDDHIGASIPGFRELQVLVGDAIVKSIPEDGAMLDIGASEGALAKTVSKLSGAETVSLDPNPSMAEHFNRGEKVPGATYQVEALGTKAQEGQLAWTEGDTLTDRDGTARPNPHAGKEINYFKPTRKFDVVHEAMVFQFIDNDRATQVARAKELMTPGGILVLEEKFISGEGLTPQQFRANEEQKDAFKEQYFTKEQIAKKAAAVGVAEKAAFRAENAAQEQKVVGMNDLMVSPGELEKVLGDNFAHVSQFWDSGNFKGYVSSDSPEALQKFLDNLGSTASEFATSETPRVVKGAFATKQEASWTPKRIDHLISEYAYLDGRVKAFAAKIDPSVFVKATTAGSFHVEEIQKEAGLLSRTRLAKESQTPFLLIRRNDKGQWQITGHEGRHRMAALATEGAKSVPVVLRIDGFPLRNLSDFDAEKLVGQEFDSGVGSSATFSEATPITFENKELINERFGDGNAFVRFSRRQTETPEFKKWFGDSKTVDSSGLPLVLYHGTSKDFDFHSFKIPKNGVWLTTDKDAASQYAQENDSRTIETANYRTFVEVNTSSRVLPLYAKIEKPYTPTPEDLDGLRKAVNYKKAQAVLFDRLRLKGFDGVDFGDGTWVVLRRPEQIKSAIGNSGQFDTTNRDIRFSRKQTETPEFKKWFGDSVVTDAAGKPLTVYHGTSNRKEINTFRTPAYFTDEPAFAEMFKDEEGPIYPVYLRIENPYRIDGDREGRHFEWDKKDVARMREEGYDGVIVTATNAATIYTPFDQNQIKSAIGNTGAFSEKPDIRFSRKQPTFYSAALRAAESLKQERGTPEQMFALLKKTPGVKAEELEWLGVEDYAKGLGKSVTKQQLVDFIAANGVQTETVTLDANGSTNPAVVRENDGGEFDVIHGDEYVSGPFVTATEAQEEADSWWSWRQQLGYRNPKTASKYGEHVLPGGENYREVLLTLPDRRKEHLARIKDLASRRAQETDQAKIDALNAEMRSLRDKQLDNPAEYQSSHWDQANVLAHVRLNDRVDSQGRRVLFVEEVQSDWHQEGKKKGYRVQLTPKIQQELTRLHEESRAKFIEMKNHVDDADDTVFFRLDGERKAINEKIQALEKSTRQGVPDAPFKNNAWAALAVKQVLRMAAEGGYDAVAWTTGAQQVDRYRLSRHVDRIVDDNGILTAWNNGNKVFAKDIPQENWEKYIGKEAAQKLAKKEPDEYGLRDLSGLDLEVGGAGMLSFYDTILPNIVKEVARKLDKSAEVEKAITFPRYQVRSLNGRVFSGPHATRAEAELRATAYDKIEAVDTGLKQPSITITDSMREGAMSGQPRFSRRNIYGNKAPLATWTDTVTPMDTKIDAAIRYLQDRHIDSKRVVEAIKRQAASLSDKWDVYLQETLFHGRAAKKTKDFITDELRPLLSELVLRRVTVEEFEEYLHNRHAEERNRQIASINPAMPDGGSGIDTADAQAYLAGLSAPKKLAFEALAKKVDAITASTRSLLVSSGLEVQGTVNAWENSYQHYVPLFREDADFSAPSGQGIGQGMSVRGPSSRRATGSSRPVVDILANLAMQRERAIVRAEKNRVATSLYGLAITNPNPNFWLPINPDAIDPAGITAAVNELINLGMNPLDAENLIREPTQSYVDPRTGLVVERVNPLLRNSDNILSLRVAGKDRFVVFNLNDPRATNMVSAMKNLDADQLGRVMALMSRFTRWFASVNTQYNPIFGVVNLTRDFGSAMLNLSSTPLAGKQNAVRKNTLPALAGIYSDLRSRTAGRGAAQGQWASLWEEYQKEGGQTGYRDQYVDSEERAHQIQLELNRLQEGDGRKAARAIFDWLSDFNETAENAVRLAAYKVALDEGMSKARAAELAKNLTVNFNRKGQVATQAGALYAFFNATVQGTARTLETLEGPAGRKIVSGGLLLGVLQALMLAAAGYDEDEPPQFLRERNFIIPLPGTDGRYLTVPMPQGFNVIPNVSRVATEWAMAGFKDTPNRAIDLMGSVLGMFNPLGSAGMSLQTVMPTAADPLVALAENKDWTGKPIAREDLSSMNPTPGYTRAKDTASWISKQVSYALNRASGGTEFQKGLLSPTPDQLDYLIGQATGGVGRETLKAQQVLTAASSGEAIPAYKVPLLGRAFGSTKDTGAQSSRFYENVRKLNSLELEVKGRKKAGTGAGSFMQENKLTRLIPESNRVYSRIEKLNKQKREMIKKGVSRESIKLIDAQRVNLMSRFNELYARTAEQ